MSTEKCPECGWPLDRAPLVVEPDGPNVIDCAGCGRTVPVWEDDRGEEAAIAYASEVEEDVDPEAHAAWNSTDGATWAGWLAKWRAGAVLRR
jgi:uncharacterized Zn finger protein (UPF0148 family)